MKGFDWVWKRLDGFCICGGFIDEDGLLGRLAFEKFGK